MPRAYKRSIRRLFSDRLIGRIDYYRFPQWRNSWGGPFNGQMRRKELFDAIITEVKPKAIIETGTFRGTTTLHFCRSGLPVYTVEGLARNFGFAKSQLCGLSNVTMLNRDSRDGLREILAGPLRNRLVTPLFFYLDAHWNDDLPLAEELDIILSACTRPIIMIDDFEVPDDQGYRYDNYGGANVLNYNYIAPYVEKNALKVLFPSAPASEETGAKRGCILLSKEAEAASMLKTGLVYSVLRLGDE